MSAGVGLAVQQLVGGLTDALAAEIQFQNGRDAVGPRQLDRAAVVQDHDHMGLDLCDLVDQAILAGGQFHRSAVIPFRLKRFGQTGKDNGDIGVLCRLNGLGQLCVGHLVPHRREALGVADVAALLLRNFPRGGHAAGMDVAGAAALIARCRGKLADVGDLLIRAQRQNTLIGQQYRALRLDGNGLGVVFGAVEHGVGAAGIHIGEHDLQDAFHRAVQYRLVQRAVLYGRDDLGIVVTVGGRHLQVKTRFQAFHTVIGGTPVTDDVPLKAPLIPQDVGEQHLVFGSIHAVDLVVAAHHRFGLGALDGFLKGGQVDLMQRTLREVRGDGQAAGLLIVGGKVLDGGPHAPALYAANVRSGQLTGQIRVLRNVLEIAAAQRAALDVNGGPQQDADILGLALVAQNLTHVLQKVRVKAGTGGAPGREADSLDAVVQAEVVRFTCLLAQTVRAVGHHHGRDAQPLDPLRVPEIRAGAKAGFFFQCHLADQCFQIARHILFSLSVIWQRHCTAHSLLAILHSKTYNDYMV
jgi:hypothetical protein